MFDRLKTTVAEQWFPLGGLAVCFALMGFCVWKALSLTPLEEAVLPGLLALSGFICAVAPEEVSDWTGFYGATTKQYRNYPSEFLRLLGMIVLISISVYLLKS